MSFVAKCALCKQKLPYTRSQTAILVEHLLENHPEQHFSIARVVKKQIRETPQQHMKRTSDMNGSSKLSQNSTKGSKRVSSSGKHADENLPNKQDFSVRRPRGRRMFYKTSVETWRPARCRITCPQCAAHQYPTIRMTADRYSQSVYGATWIMTCWPFCFLPCLFSAPTKYRLHCSKCNAFLGLYNPNQEVVQSNSRRRSSASSHGSNSRKVSICSERYG